MTEQLHEIEEGKLKKRRITPADFELVAERIHEDYTTRKEERKDLEKQWKDIDRQIAMDPDLSFKFTAEGQRIPERAWMAELELPNQAQTLEVLTADSRRMRSPDTGLWFSAHAEVTDEFLRVVESKSLILGDENDLPSRINQDNADKLVEGWLAYFHRQYDFDGNMDLIDAEAFKYGMGIGRVRTVTKEVFKTEARGVMKKGTRFPALLPRSIKNTYLDTSSLNAMNEGYVLGPSTIHYECRKLVDVVMAANLGNTDPDSPQGGWMPKNLVGIEGDKHGNVEIIESEGDLIVPRKTVRSVVVPNVIITTVVGKRGDNIGRNVIRLRFNKHPFPSYIEFPYHKEDISKPYATSPLMKGRPVQIAATEALKKLMDSAVLNVEPPIRWNRSDPNFVATGGPVIEPRASWGTNGSDVEPVQIGEMAGLLNVYVALENKYSDVTGVNAPRLGAQTVSHTTAFAKEAELSRGTVRTVDYVRSTLKGPLTQFLYMEYELAREAMGNREDVFHIDAYGGFVQIPKSVLPERATFEAHGSGGPAEEQAKVAQRLQAANLAISLEGFKLSAGMQPSLNIDEIQRQVMRDGGWQDIDPFFSSSGTEAANQGPPPVAGAERGDAGPLSSVVQSIAGSG